MSAAAIGHVWNVTGVSPEEKLILLWIANSAGALGYPYSPEWIGMGDFISADHWRALEVVWSLIDKGLLVANEPEGGGLASVWVAYEGPYQPSIDWNRETKSRSRRVIALVERDGPECSYCRRIPVAYEVDHFIPRAKGGPDVMANLVLACAPCNRAKRDKMPDVFLADDQELLHAIKCNLVASEG